ARPQCRLQLKSASTSILGRLPPATKRFRHRVQAMPGRRAIGNGKTNATFGGPAAGSRNGRDRVGWPTAGSRKTGVITTNPDAGKKSPIMTTTARDTATRARAGRRGTTNNKSEGGSRKAEVVENPSRSDFRLAFLINPGDWL